MLNLFTITNMKNTANKLFTIIITFILTIGVNAQITDIGKMISGSTSDANKLLEAYLKPYANAFGADLNAGWYNTAKNHKKLGFDLTFSVSAAFVPKVDKTFDARTLGLSTTDIVGESSPTVAGKKVNGQAINYTLGTPPYSASMGYALPKGTNWGVIPAPMLQLGIGTIKDIDLVVRYVPKTNFGDYGSVDVWGVALKHNIKQYIPAIKMAPFFHLSVFLGYTQMRTSLNLDFKPSVYNQMFEPDPTITATSAFDNQKLEMTFKGFTGNILASFDFPVVSIYGGAGISNTTAKIGLLGDYPIPYVETSGANAGDVFIRDNEIAKDPLNAKIKATDGSPTKPRLNAGIKFKMAIITIHFDYTYANYSVATAGLGISVR
jgi:hypothetical protein